MEIERNQIKKAEGTWSLEIWAECPHCKEDVDFTCSADFFEGFKFETIGPNAFVLIVMVTFYLT
ncbi:hypothetical protein K027_0423 [Acinetobacter baumannii 45057_1]|uniref:hypothetical protein n=1 Tax=Acinetobacter baumannii TaxID=470 RepID=UPI000460E5C3|nr:hypothetical protein [Acinetobacter baumannii]KCZ34235.1 hypothetical protein K027_1499 [Acinetobacter baumannii 45057_1]KCZ36195.1 hypothetical protein K027_0423 [Acinetobacter baumannii 45057_1]